jgi:hypothetical protein
MLSLATDRLRLVFKVVAASLPPKMRAELGRSLQQLEQVEEVLGGLGSDE